VQNGQFQLFIIFDVAIQRQPVMAMRCGFEWMDEELRGLFSTSLDENILFFLNRTGSTTY